ncbi:DUF2612 domain-containing protein [Desulfovibrio cuneatus]|uniref:DUF2612 domain-containing protein n=1 Tax=Desulfovibrio cuneatus TaxID=159728 RepID=UPI00040E5669|nr:DUF2612 domain-containing protein [Desulfovibrio cuneatus]
MEEYLNLVPSQHRQRPRFMATVQAVLAPLHTVEALLEELRTAFDLDTATGRQLDAVGVRVGRTRYLHTPLEGVFFSWNEEGVGWGQGVWKGKYDAENGLTTLPDDVYRTLLKAKVAANAWNGTTPGAYEAWEVAFADTGSMIVLQDNQDMSMIVGIAGRIMNPVFEQLLLQQYVPLKPEGVRIQWYAVTPDGGPLFAWNCNSPALSGWADSSGNGGRWPRVLRPQA